MAVKYELHVYNRSGVMQARFNDFDYITYTREVNAPGLLEFRVPTAHGVRDVLELDGQIEVRRANPAAGIDWYTDFYGLYRAEKRRASNGVGTFTALCPGQMHFLRRSLTAYPAGTANRVEFSSVAGETILKTLVTYNATGSGTTADGRQRNVDSWGANISVEADGAGGSSFDEACANINLLTALQRVAAKAGLDFSLVKTGAQAWEFRTDTLLGDDKTASVVFSPDRGNMDNIAIERYSLDEGTVAIVGGQGTEGSRSYVVRTGANYSALYNSREMFVSAQQYSTTTGLQAAGDARLEEQEARDKFDFDVLDTEATRYGRDWDLGDLVTGIYEDLNQSKKVQAITVSFDPNNSDNPETIKPKLVTP